MMSDIFECTQFLFHRSLIYCVKCLTLSVYIFKILVKIRTEYLVQSKITEDEVQSDCSDCGSR